MPAGWDGHLPLPYLIALIPLLWIPTLVITVAGFASHEPALEGVAAVVVASLLRKIAYWMENLNSPNTAQRVAEKLANNRETSRETGNEAVVESARHGRFRVMTLNCRFGRANAAAIVSAVKKHDIAVLALQELTDDLVAQLDAAGLSDLLPYRQLGENKETDNGGLNGVWIRIQPSDMSPVTAVIPAADVPGVCSRSIRCVASRLFPHIRSRRCVDARNGRRASSAWGNWRPRRSGTISPLCWVI